MNGVPPGYGNVAELLESAAARRGTAPAIVGPDGRVRWTFEGLAEAGARLAGRLIGLGVEPGDRVLVLEADPGTRYGVVAGVLWAGATVTVPPASLPLWRAISTAAADRPRALIASPGLWPLVVGHPGLRSVPLRISTGGRRLPGMIRADDGQAAPVRPRIIPLGSPAIASFTSGSTGPAKLIARSHGVLAAQHLALQRMRNLDESARDLVGLPLLVLHNLGSGVTSILPPRSQGSGAFGERVRRALVDSQATSSAGFPHLYEMAVRDAAPGELRGLRTIHVGGSRVTPTLLRALSHVAPDARVTVVYGSTEVEPIAAIDAGDYLEALAGSDPADGICSGRLIDGLELRVDPAGAIHLRGDRVAGSVDHDGWLATGDVGRLDDRDRLWLLGRAANAVGRLHPFEVERAVEALGWVRRAVLVRRDDGEAAEAVIAIEPDRWSDGRARRAQASDVRRLAAARGWSIGAVLIRRRLPVLAGPAAKVDTDRLAPRGRPSLR